MPLNIDIRKNDVVGPIILELESKLEKQLSKHEAQISNSTKKLLLKNAMTAEEIAEVLNVPKEFVLKIKEELGLNS